jgi:hypothetical protein
MLLTVLIARVTHLRNSRSNPEKALCESRFHLIVNHNSYAQTTLLLFPLLASIVSMDHFRREQQWPRYRPGLKMTQFWAISRTIWPQIPPSMLAMNLSVSALVLYPLLYSCLPSRLSYLYACIVRSFAAPSIRIPKLGYLRSKAQ